MARLTVSTGSGGGVTLTQVTDTINQSLPYLLPASNGTDDTAAINAVLEAARVNGRAVVKGRPGTTYTLKDRLIVGSHTTLDMTGCLINGANNKNALTNYAAVTGRSVTDVATTAGSTTLTSATAAFTSADVGKAVQVIGAGPNYGKADAPGSWYSKIVSVTNATTAVLAEAATLTKTGASATIFAGRDTNITIIGGTWTGGEREAVSQNLNGHQFYLRRVDGLKVSPRRMVSTRSGGDGGGGGYAISCGDVTRVESYGVDFQVGSDGIHFQGPAQTIDVHDMSGFTGDDLIAFTGVDGQTQTGSLLGDVEGDITDVHVRSGQPNNAWTALKVTSGTGTNGIQRKIRRFYASGFTGKTQQGAVNVVDYAGTTWFDGTISDVNVLVAPSEHQVQLRATYAQTVRLNDIAWDSTLAAPTAGIIKINQPVVDLRITNLTVPGTATGAGIGINFSAGVTRFRLAGLSIPDGLANFQALNVSGASLTFGAVSLTGIYRVATAGNLINVAATATNVKFADIQVSDGWQSAGSILAMSADSVNAGVLRVTNWRQPSGAIAILRAPFTVFLAASQFAISAGSGGVQAASDAANPVRVTASTTSIDSGTFLGRSGSQTLSVSGSGIKLDAALLSPLAGDQVYNTNSAVAGGVGVALSTGTGWQNLTTATGTSFTVPGAPTALTASASGTSMSLSLTAPASNGGAPISDYTWQYKKSSDSTWTTYTHTASPTPGILITGLTASTSYDFRAAAVNSVGTGAYSATATQSTGSAAAAGAYKAAVLNDTPSAFWMLDEASGNALDSGAGGYNGTPVGALTRQSASSGPGGAPMTTFGGGYFSTATLGSLGSVIGTSGVTVEFIVRTTSTAKGTVLGVVNTGFTTSLSVQLNSNASGTATANTHTINVRNQGGTGQQVTFTANLSDGAVHHVVMVLNPADYTQNACYVDGTEVTTYVGKPTSSLGGTTVNFAFPVGIGANNGRGTFDTTFTGDLGGVAVYGKVLSAARVSAHRAALVTN